MIRYSKSRVVLCRIRLFPTMISKIKWVLLGLPLIQNIDLRTAKEFASWNLNKRFIDNRSSKLVRTRIWLTGTLVTPGAQFDSGLWGIFRQFEEAPGVTSMSVTQILARTSLLERLSINPLLRFRDVNSFVRCKLMFCKNDFSLASKCGSLG